MGLLSDALPREQMTQESAIKSDRGVYRAYFIGMTPKYAWISPFGDACRLCKGSRNGRNGEPGECVGCNGTGKKTEDRVKLRYHLENNEIEEEEVNYKLSAGGQSRDGKTFFSPTTLFVRLRALSGIRDATEQQIDAWYSELPQPPKVPCTVVINDNKNQTALKIESVMLRQVPQRANGAASQSTAARPPQPQAPPTRQPAPPPVTQVAQQAEAADDDTEPAWAGEDGSFDDYSIPF